MCEALRELMAPEIKQEVDKAVGEAVRETVRETTIQNRKDMICNALKGGSSAADISRIMQIPLEEVEAVAKELTVK